MTKFNFAKKLELNEYGQGAYLEFNLLTFREIEKLSKISIDTESTDPKKLSDAITLSIGVLTDQFISGKLPNGKDELAPVAKEDMADLPVEILTKAMNFLSGAQTQG